jgi:hypothetical protein
MSGDALDRSSISLALRALRAGVAEAGGNGDGIATDAITLLLSEVHREFGSEGVLVLVFALAVVAGNLVVDLAHHAGLDVDAYMASASLAEIARQAKHAEAGQ